MVPQILAATSRVCFTFQGIPPPDFTAIYRYSISFRCIVSIATCLALYGRALVDVERIHACHRRHSPTILSFLPNSERARRLLPEQLNAVLCALCQHEKYLFRARPAGIMSTVKPSSLACMKKGFQTCAPKRDQIRGFYLL